MKFLGVLLILAGVAGIIYGGFSFTTHKKAIDMGPIQINKAEHHSVPIPPILGAAAIVGGGMLIYFGAGHPS
jgi:hypothetical protein